MASGFFKPLHLGLNHFSSVLSKVRHVNLLAPQRQPGVSVASPSPARHHGRNKMFTRWFPVVDVDRPTQAASSLWITSVTFSRAHTSSRLGHTVILLLLGGSLFELFLVCILSRLFAEGCCSTIESGHRSHVRYVQSHLEPRANAPVARLSAIFSVIHFLLGGTQSQ